MLLTACKPLHFVQGSVPLSPNLKHFVVQVAAHNEATVSIAGCLLQLLCSAYCLKLLSILPPITRFRVYFIPPITRNQGLTGQLTGGSYSAEILGQNQAFYFYYKRQSSGHRSSSSSSSAAQRRELSCSAHTRHWLAESDPSCDIKFHKNPSPGSSTGQTRMSTPQAPEGAPVSACNVSCSRVVCTYFDWQFLEGAA